MIIIENASGLKGERLGKTFIQSDNAENSLTVNAEGLLLFPGLIDPHVHFRTPGLTHKEDWQTAAKAALAGGYTTVFDMPNTLPPTITAAHLHDKKALINAELIKARIPLRYELFFGADKNHLHEIAGVAKEIIGIKVFMGCSTGNLVIDDDESLQAVFKIAAEHDLIVAVHAEDEQAICANKAAFQGTPLYPQHSELRNIEVAVIAVKKAILYAKTYGTRLYILHVSSAEEIALIRAAKEQGLPVYAETTPHHLFLNESAYTKLNGYAVVNPPLRAPEHNAAVMNAILDGTIDTIGSDHAPHTRGEKEQAYGSCPSGMPGIETTLPLLLTAYHAGKITLETILRITVENPRRIFRLPANDDVILIDLKQEKVIDNAKLHTKCQWSAFHGQTLQGWPRYTIVRGQCFAVESLSTHYPSKCEE